MDFGIAGRKAIVGGASAGLGKACAMSLAREGVDVTIVARTLANIEAAAEEIRVATGAKVTPVAVDINTDEGRAEVLKACPAPDIVVNNSGGPPSGNFRDWDRAAWIAALNGNMLGAIFMIKDTVDGMIARKFGRIVNITSINGLRGKFGQANYAAAKAGLIGLTKTAAREFGKKGVTVNAVAPGMVMTDMARTLPEEIFGRAVAEAALPELADPQDISNAVLFLLSDAARAITGEVLRVDAGQYI